MSTPRKADGKKAQPKALSQRTKIYGEPRNRQDRLFAERYVVHLDHNLAYTEAGWKYNNSGAARKLKSLKKYIDKLALKVEAKLVHELSYTRKDILDHMAAIALANPHDYYQDFEILDPKTQTLLRGRALKPINQLTRLQASAIEDLTYHLESGRISYRLPSLSTKMSALTTLAETTGVTKKKDEGRQAHVHFHDVPIEKLRDLMGSFATLLGPQASRQVLGLTEEDQND